VLGGVELDTSGGGHHCGTAPAELEKATRASAKGTGLAEASTPESFTNIAGTS
jgi:hypothetical protein